MGCDEDAIQEQGRSPGWPSTLFQGGNVILEAVPNCRLRDIKRRKTFIVYEKGGKTVLSVIRPTVAMQMIDNVELQKVAEAVEGQLKKAFDAIK
ncbi:MAG: hypothetical protein KJ814_09900 [Proteobacteria bacterium]|nr:hypothetical protein [Pseudomonadota bacterium]